MQIAHERSGYDGGSDGNGFGLTEASRFVEVKSRETETWWERVVG
jgi:hypothetical protein